MRLFFDLNPELEGSVFLAGVGRSGTTWVGDVINACNDYRVMFEPFYPQKVPECRGFEYRQYLPPEDTSAQLRATAQRVLSGKIRNAWIDRYNTKFVARKRLIKDIRANLMLKWIKVNFPELRIIVLMRHPMAVAASKRKAKWGTHLDEFLKQPRLLDDHLKPFEGLLRAEHSDFEKYILAWCVENYVPLRQFRSGEAHFACYEDFCREPDREYGKLFSFLGLPLTNTHKKAFRRPSAMSSATSAIVLGENLVDSWRAQVSNAEINVASGILRAFGLERIYADGSAPLMDPNLIAEDASRSTQRPD